MNGDEWGLLDVIPAQNVEHCRRVTEAYREHHKDTDFSSTTGWSTSPFVIPPPAIAIASRRIRLTDLESVLGNVLQKARGVDSCVDYTGTPFPCPNSFAFALSFDSYWQSEGIYGDHQDGVVQSLFVTSSLWPEPSRREELIEAIVTMARRFDLILFDAESVLDLRDPKAVAVFVNRDE